MNIFLMLNKTAADTKCSGSSVKQYDRSCYCVIIVKPIHKRGGKG